MRRLALLLELTVMPAYVYLLVTDLVRDDLRGMFVCEAVCVGAGGNVDVWVCRQRERSCMACI